jgi:molecular chaperone GrpE
MSQDTTSAESADDFGALPVEELEARLRDLENQLGVAKDEQVRLIAEMDNQRKRAARDVDAARKFGVERLLNDLMPVCDGLEMGLSQGGSDPTRLREGMDLTLKLLLKAAEGHGLKRLHPVGEAFNPEWHPWASHRHRPRHDQLVRGDHGGRQGARDREQRGRPHDSVHCRLHRRTTKCWSASRPSARRDEPAEHAVTR